MYIDYNQPCINASISTPSPTYYTNYGSNIMNYKE